MVLREHICNVTNQRDRFYFVGRIQLRSLKLAKLEITARDFCWFPDTSLGLHWSIHDANKSHTTGRIHMRLGKGAFRIYPGGQSLGTQVIMQEIPPFSQIRGAIHVGEPHIGWTPVDTILSRLKPLREPKVSGSTTVNIMFHAGRNIWLRQHFLLVEQNNTAALEDWLSHEQSFWEQEMRLRGEPEFVVSMEDIDLFKAPRCWLASVVAFREDTS